MYELIRKSFREKNLFREFFYRRQFPPPPPPPPGLLFMDCVSNKWNKIAAHFWWSRQCMVKHPLSFSQYLRSSFKQKLSHKSQQQPAIWVKSQTVSTSFTSSIQIEYLLIKNISYDYKNWQSGWWSANDAFQGRNWGMYHLVNFKS